MEQYLISINRIAVIFAALYVLFLTFHWRFEFRSWYMRPYVIATALTVLAIALAPEMFLLK